MPLERITCNQLIPHSECSLKKSSLTKTDCLSFFLKPLNYNKNADCVFSLFYESLLDSSLMRKEKNN